MRFFVIAMLFVLFTYGGWNEAAYISAEVKGGQRSILKVLVISIVVLTARTGIGAAGGIINYISKSPTADGSEAIVRAKYWTQGEKDSDGYRLGLNYTFKEGPTDLIFAASVVSRGMPYDANGRRIAAHLRRRKELQHRRGDDAERALGADEQVLEVVAGVVLAQRGETVPHAPVGQHHRIFMPPEEARSAAYQAFWRKLARGGLVDIEFIVHFLQLRDHRALLPGISDALAALIADSKLNPAIRAAHGTLGRFLIAARLLLPEGELPPESARAVLASACECEGYLSFRAQP